MGAMSCPRTQIAADAYNALRERVNSLESKRQNFHLTEVGEKMVVREIWECTKALTRLEDVILGR
jgi:hypothetical protein